MLQLTTAAGVMAKAHVVASEDTISALIRFQSSLIRNFMELSGSRIPLRIRQSEIDRLSRDIANEANESARWVELMKQFNLQCSSDQQKWKALAVQAELTQSRLHALIERHSELSALQVRETIRYAKETMQKGLTTMRLLPDVLLATRKEMELTLDEATYRALSEATAVEAEMVGTRLLDKIPIADGNHS
jgi:hypothetical protein